MFIWSLLLVFYLSKLPVTLQLPLNDENEPGRSALENFPLVDGHNDLPHNLYKKLNNKIENFPFEKNLSQDSIFGFNACNSCHTDLPRIKQGKLGAQFWVAYVKCRLPYYTNYVSRTMEQIDVIKRLISKYPDNMELVTTADGILETFKRRKLASLIGLEGGHSIDDKLSLLRQYYELGVRYMTLTHSCNLPWADSSLVDQLNSTLSNLTQFGEKVVLEMNRLGMMVDLSHVSYNVMNKAIDISKAPVIFSHSSAYSVYPHHRNVRDDILLKVKINGGIVMVNFYSEFVGRTNVTIRNVVDHINHIVDTTGIDHVGIGSDFDGVISVPNGLEDVSKFPNLFDLLKELNPNRWTIANLEKLAGRNFYRVFKQVEKIKKELSTKQPDENWIPEEDLAAIKSESDNCIV